MNPPIKLSHLTPPAARGQGRRSTCSRLALGTCAVSGDLDSTVALCELELSTNTASRDRRDAINGNYFNSVAVTVDCAMFDFQLIAERLIKRGIAIKTKIKKDKQVKREREIVDCCRLINTLSSNSL